MSKLDDLAALLRSMEAFRHIPAERLKLIAYLASSVDLKAGQEVLRAGAPSDKVVILMDGALETQGTAPALRFGPGCMLGEISILTGTPERSTVRAATDATASIMAKAQFEDLLDRLPEFKTGLLLDFAHRLARQ